MRHEAGYKRGKQDLEGTPTLKLNARTVRAQSARQSQDEALAIARASQLPNQLWIESLGRHFTLTAGELGKRQE